MGAKRRSEIFCPEEQAIVHVMNRCVRKCFLLGPGKKARKTATDRRRMFENELRKATGGFAIDLLSHAIMDNHFHLILRSRPDVALEWSDTDIVLQWHKLCPIFKDKDGKPIAEPDEGKVAKVAEDTKQVAIWRRRLSDISWFLKLISERIARRCNAADDAKGHFWESRFKSVLLLDEKALLACSVYVDLNRVQAELAASLEESDYTSVQRRLQAFVIRTSMRKMLAEQFGSKSKASIVTSVVIDPAEEDLIPETTAADKAAIAEELLPDAHLSPIQIDEKNDPIGPQLSHGTSRCSDKGFFPMTQEKYIELLRWTADQIRHRHDGQKFQESPELLEQLELEPEVWCKLTTQFTDLFFAVAGVPESIDTHRSCGTGKRFNMPHKTREMLTA